MNLPHRLKMPTRRKFGIWIAALAIGSVPTLMVAGVPVVHLSSVYDAGANSMSTSLSLHWSSLVVLFVFALGIALILPPSRPRPSAQIIPPSGA
jgi:hypothetical protein